MYETGPLAQEFQQFRHQAAQANQQMTEILHHMQHTTTEWVCELHAAVGRQGEANLRRNEWTQYFQPKGEIYDVSCIGYTYLICGI